MGSATNKPDGHRQLEQRYHALDCAANLRILLGDYHALKNRRFAGDTSASDILIDLHRAIELAGLTGRQSEALRLVYGEDLTQVEAGRRMGLEKDAVNHLLTRAIEAVADVYAYWVAHGEGYTTTYIREETE